MFGTVAFAQSPYAATGSNIFQSVVGETAAASDSLASLPTYAARIAESTSVADSLLGRPTYAAQFIDTVSSQDASGTQFVGYAFVFDAAFGLDVLTSAATYAARIAESTSVADSLLGQPLWVLINNTQDAEWTNIAAV